MWPLAFSASVNRPVRFDDDIDAELLPRQRGGPFLDGEALDLGPLTTSMSSSASIRRRLLAVDLALEPALRRVVLEQVGEVVGRDEVVDRNDLVALAEQSLLDHRAEHEPADAAEAIDADCSHLNVVVWGLLGHSVKSHRGWSVNHQNADACEEPHPGELEPLRHDSIASCRF